jgi:hypothetical protein
MDLMHLMHMDQSDMIPLPATVQATAKVTGICSLLLAVPPADRNDWRRTGGKNRHMRRRVHFSTRQSFAPSLAPATSSTALHSALLYYCWCYPHNPPLAPLNPHLFSSRRRATGHEHIIRHLSQLLNTAQTTCLPPPATLLCSLPSNV